MKAISLVIILSIMFELPKLTSTDEIIIEKKKKLKMLSTIPLVKKKKKKKKKKKTQHLYILPYLKMEISNQNGMVMNTHESLGYNASVNGKG